MILAPPCFKSFLHPWGVSIFPLKYKSAMYTFVQERGGGSRRDPNHKSMYNCAYMYVHLSLSPPPPVRSVIYVVLLKLLFSILSYKSGIIDSAFIIVLY